MGMCKPSGGIEAKFGKVGDLKAYGDPNSRIDLYNIDNPNELLQQRWYDSNGIAEMNRDWKHSEKGGEHKFPHDHPWDWTQKTPRLDYDEDREINNHYC